MDKERKNILKIKTMLNKNKFAISRIVVSQEFMMQLMENADLVDIESKQRYVETKHSFNDKDNISEDLVETTYLFGIECCLSVNVLRGAVVEMKNGEYFVLKNI